MYFCRALAIECIDNNIGVELGDNSQRKITCKTLVCVPCDKFTVKHYGGMWDPIKKRKN